MHINTIRIYGKITVVLIIVVYPFLIPRLQLSEMPLNRVI